MAEAKITLSLNPAEFDHMREVLRRDVQNQLEIGNTTSVDPRTRHEAKQEALIGQELLKKLR